MCPKVSEKPKRAHESVTLTVKLDIIKCFNCGEGNKDIVPLLSMPTSTIGTIYLQR